MSCLTVEKLVCDLYQERYLAFLTKQSYFENFDLDISDFVNKKKISFFLKRIWNHLNNLQKFEWNERCIQEMYEFQKTCLPLSCFDRWLFNKYKGFERDEAWFILSAFYAVL